MTTIQAQRISAKQLQCHQNFHLIQSCKVVILLLKFKSGSNTDHGLFVGWVESAGLGLSACGPTYLQAILVLSAKPNKMTEDRTIPLVPHNTREFKRVKGLKIEDWEK
jgi:hypothetical protein